MDPLSTLLGGIRAEGSAVGYALLQAPWAIRFSDRAPLTMVCILRGAGVLLLPDGTKMRVTAGDTAVVCRPEPFHLADRPDSVAGPHAEYEVACFLPDAGCAAEDLGGIRWKDNPNGTTALVVGAYQAWGSRHERLLRVLPSALLVGGEEGMCDWLEEIAVDAARHRAGSQALMDRVLDWALVCTLRTWFDQAGAAAPAWYRGVADPVVGPALEVIHKRLSARWTVASLAAAAGVSRALFAKRFTEMMGKPPLTYLTECRMDEAAELLVETDLTVAQVAEAIGYADAFGFSAAFKRSRGQSPSAFRAVTARSGRSWVTGGSKGLRGRPDRPVYPPESAL